VVWNTLIAPFTLDEKLTPTLLVGVALIAAGATGTSFFGNHEDQEYTLQVVQDKFFRPAVGIYLCFLALWAAFNILVLQKRSNAQDGEPWQPGHPIRGLSLGMTAGSIAGNMFCVKAFVELVETSIRRKDSGIWRHWLPYVTLLMAVFFALSNVYFLQKAVREYEALFMGAVFEGTLIISACISGFVVFDDADNLKWWELLLYWLMLFGMVVGILLVAIASGGDWSQPKEPTSGDDLAISDSRNMIRGPSALLQVSNRISRQTTGDIRSRSLSTDSPFIDSPFTGGVRLDLVERALSVRSRRSAREGEHTDNAPESTAVGKPHDTAAACGSAPGPVASNTQLSELE